MEVIQKRIQNKELQAAIDEMIKTMNLLPSQPDQFRLKMEEMQVKGQDIKTILTPIERFSAVPDRPDLLQSSTSGKQIAVPGTVTPAGRLTAKTAAGKVAKFEPVLDEKGEVVGQKNLTTGEIKSDPRTIKDTTLIQTLKSIGIDPDTPEGKALVKKILTTAKTKIDINKGDELPFDIPKGFMLLDKDDPAKGVTPIPGSNKDNVTGENAGKAQMLRTAKRAANGIDALIFDKDGKVDTVNLVNAQLGTPGTQGRELRQKMEFGIQAITRLETGAAMPQEELDNTRTRFMPTPLDSDKIVKLKIKMFRDFIGGTLKLLDPSGRFNAERFQAELEERGGEGAPAEVPEGSKLIGTTKDGSQVFESPNRKRFKVKP